MTVKEYFLPQTLDEALELLAKHGSSLLVMAGGTLAMPLINDGISLPEKVMGLRQAGLNYINQTNGTVTVGATTTLNQLSDIEAISVLQEAANNAASLSVRNMGTVGGNIFAPSPSGDVAVALLALDAKLKLVDPNGERIVPLADFYIGFMMTDLQPDELLAEIQVPVPAGKTIYIKFGRKLANTPSVVAVAIHLVMHGDQVKDARIALNGAGPNPFRAKNAEAVLVGSSLNVATIDAAAKAAMEESDPFTDAVASESYRRKMVGVFVGRALNQLAEQED